MIDPKKVSAVVLTRDGKGLQPIRDTLRIFHDYCFEYNTDHRIYARYEAAALAECDYVYVQDDDFIAPTKQLCDEYEPGQVLCNVYPTHLEEYRRKGLSLVGWGAIFPRVFIDFSSYFKHWPQDDVFLRECDRVFTAMNFHRLRMEYFGGGHLPHAHGLDRMGHEPRHRHDFFEILRRIRTLSLPATA